MPRPTSVNARLKALLLNVLLGKAWVCGRKNELVTPNFVRRVKVALAAGDAMSYE